MDETILDQFLLISQQNLPLKNHMVNTRKKKKKVNIHQNQTLKTSNQLYISNILLQINHSPMQVVENRETFTGKNR